MNASRNYFTSSLAWILTFMLAIGWQIAPFMPNPHAPPAEATGEKMVLLWDTALGGTVPLGWRNASLTYGGYFLRGDTVANVGNPTSPTHDHTSGTVAFQSQNTPTIVARSHKTNTDIALTHGHAISMFAMDVATILPVYRNLIAIACDSGIPATLPQYAIALFDTTPGAGFSSYSSQNSNMIRIDSTSGGTGGSTNHTHTNLVIASDAPDTTQLVTAGAGYTTSSAAHTHSYVGTAPASSDHTPLHTEVILGSVTNSGGTAIPIGMIAMFNGDPNIDDSNWDVISDPAEAFGEVYIEAQASYQTGQGYATHTHSINVASSVVPDDIDVVDGSPNVSGIGAHTHTISGNFSDENNEPAYINVVVAKKEASFALGVTGPTDVTLASVKPSETGETTFAADELIVVTDGGSGWSLTVIMTVTLNDGGGGHTIPNANVKLRTDGIPVGGDDTGDTYTLWSEIITFTNETTSGTYSLDATKAIGTRDVGGSGDDITNIRPTIQVVAPVNQYPADYDGTMQFTVA